MIKVYCPHTAIDAAPGGNADWLADIVTGRLTNDAYDRISDGSNHPQPQPQHLSGDSPYALYQFPSAHHVQHELLDL